MEELIVRLRAARSVMVLTGSGISAESGLPTFRGAGGLWRTHRVEELASPQGFARDPHLVWTWYNERGAAHRRARPNAGHDALATLERRIPDFTLATQNVETPGRSKFSLNMVATKVDGVSYRRLPVVVHLGITVRITKEAVAREARRSPATLYRFPDLVERVNAVAARREQKGPRPSEPRRLAQLDENAKLKRQNELLLAENLHLTRALVRFDPNLGRKLPASLDEARGRSARRRRAR